jgi:hypothetical protein
MIKLLVRVVLLVALLAAGYVVLAESGEVVVLETRDRAGDGQQTRLWIVDDGGYSWLRSGDPESAWLARLRAIPDVSVTRDGVERDYFAVPVEDASLRERINELMLAKYGLAERILRALMMDAGGATPVRLDPR